MYWQLRETDCVAQEGGHTGRPGKEEGGGRGENYLLKGRKVGVGVGVGVGALFLQ